MSECPSCKSEFIVFSDVWNTNVCAECGEFIEKKYLGKKEDNDE